MTKMDISKLLSPDPLPVDTKGLGTILLSHWTLGTIKEVSRILKNEQLNSEQFLIEFVRELGRFPSDCETLSEQYKKGARITEPEKLAPHDAEKISEEYIKKWKNNILYWVTYDEEDKGSLEIDKFEDESSPDYFYRIVKKSVERSEEQARKLVEKLTVSGTARKIAETFASNQVPIGALSQQINEIRKSQSTFASIKPTHHKLLDIPENPIHTTNNLLKNQSGQFERLIELVASQAEQAVLLNDQTDLLLRGSMESSKWTRYGIWVAAAGIALSLPINIYSIYENAKSEKELSVFSSDLVILEKQKISTQVETNDILHETNDNFTNTNKSIQDLSEKLAVIAEITNRIEKDNSSQEVIKEIVRAINALTEQLRKNSVKKSDEKKSRIKGVGDN